MNQPLPDSLRETIADILEMEPSQVTPALDATQTDTWDSFRHLQVILALEGEYGVQFDPGEIPNLTSVQALCNALRAKGVDLGSA